MHDDVKWVAGKIRFALTFLVWYLAWTALDRALVYGPWLVELIVFGMCVILVLALAKLERYRRRLRVGSLPPSLEHKANPETSLTQDVASHLRPSPSV